MRDFRSRRARAVSIQPQTSIDTTGRINLGSGTPGVVVGGFMQACSPRVSNAGAVLVCIGREPPIETAIIENSVMRMIPPLDPDGSTFGSSVNRWGEVVGSAYRPGSGWGVHEGFIYREGEIFPLVDVLDSSADGWHIVGAADINDDGLIAATAKYKAGEDRAVLLVPIR